MTMFVHIADERDRASIRRNGLRLPKRRWRQVEGDVFKYGVFALPVVADFMLSHQWLRELKARRHRTAVGIYFRIHDDERVWVGRYNAAKASMTAAEAANHLHSERALGLEVIIPRAISASEVHAVRDLPQVVGWRYMPNARDRTPCGCSFCQRGKIKSRKLRDAYDKIEDLRTNRIPFE
jgi:hypothetical protein